MASFDRFLSFLKRCIINSLKSCCCMPTYEKKIKETRGVGGGGEFKFKWKQNSYCSFILNAQLVAKERKNIPS